MTIAEIMSIETNNQNTIILHKEGIFYRAYELSVYLLCTYIKSLKYITLVYNRFERINIKSLNCSHLHYLCSKLLIDNG